jgi:integrase
MATGPITKSSVDAMKCSPDQDREILWDTGVRGFGVIAFRNGGKVYCAQYRKDGRSRRTRIGEHGRLTPEDARKLAKVILGAVESGADPIAERRAARAVRTFGAVADDFLKLHVAAKRKRRTLEEYTLTLRNNVLPFIGARRIVELRRADVTKLHNKQANTPYQANKALSIISAVWNWAAKRDEVAFADNPAKGVERYREQGRERYLTIDELGRIGVALIQGETIGLPYTIDETRPKSKHAPKPEKRRTKLDPFAAAAIRLLILTGARRREILDARWEHVDFERGILNLPDSKTGKKSIYLSAAAQAVLASLPRVEGNPHIVPGAMPGAPRADLKKPWAAICKSADLQGVRLHDLRHSFASFGAGASLGLPIIGKLLGHSQPSTTHRYAHLDASPMRRAVETIGATISAAMAGASTKATALSSARRAKP